jgi:lipoyl(octanoyl) transferase
MRRFTEERDEQTLDELWLLEHPPLYTLGLNGDSRHLLQPTDLPVIKTDRGGQITYHGPGQLVAYLLLDLRRKKLGARGLIEALESAIIGLLKQYGIEGQSRREAPGVYVAGCKIASLGLRVRKGCSYHGLSLNVNLDLTPFFAIDPCGYPGLAVTSLAQLGIPVHPFETMAPLAGQIMQSLGYSAIANDSKEIPL